MKEAQEMLPALRMEYAQVSLELRQEEADVAELQNSDKDYLDELKVSIAEQEYVSMLSNYTDKTKSHCPHSEWSCRRSGTAFLKPKLNSIV